MNTDCSGEYIFCCCWFTYTSLLDEGEASLLYLVSLVFNGDSLDTYTVIEMQGIMPTSLRWFAY